MGSKKIEKPKATKTKAPKKAKASPEPITMVEPENASTIVGGGVDPFEATVKEEAKALAVQATRTFAPIASNEHRTEVVAIVSEAKAKQKAIEAYFKPMKDAARGLLDSIRKREAEALKPYEEVEAGGKRVLVQYEEQKERERAEAEAAARIAQEKEAKKVADELRKAGLDEEAEDVLAGALVGSQPEFDMPKDEGLSMRETWTYEITDPGLINRDYLIPDEKAIGAIVRAKKQDAERMVGGIRVIRRLTPAVK